MLETSISTAAEPRFASERHGRGSGLVVHARGATLDAVGAERLFAWLRDAGYLLLRGFRPTLDEFSAFVRRSSGRVTIDPARSLYRGTAQKVDAGYDAVGLHCENGNSPFMPDLCWFFCETAASAGSETTVCDGQRAWAALSEPARSAFAAQPIVYTRRVEADKWKAFVTHARNEELAPERIQVADLRALVRDDRTRIDDNGDGSITYRFTTWAVHPTLFGGELAFAHSVLGPSYNYERPSITFADGSELGATLLADVAAATEAVTEDIAWQSGDVVLIDNTRVMHGRRAIVDPRRTIFNALSYLR